MSLKRRLFAVVAAPVLVAGVALAAAGGSARAATPNVLSNGVVGYSAVENGNQTYFTHQVSQFGLGDPQYSVSNPRLPLNTTLAAELNSIGVGHWAPFSNPGSQAVAAARVGFCGGTRAFGRTTNAGRTMQELIVPVSATTYDVVALVGQFAATGGDPCLNATLPSGLAAVVLRHVPLSHTMQLQLLFDGRHAHNGTGAGFGSFIATDLSDPTSNQVNTPGPVFLGGNSEFYEAENGLLGATGDATQSLPGTVLPDFRFPNLALVEAHVLLNGNTIGGSEVRATLQSNSAWDAVADATQVGGVITGAPSVFSNDHFDSFVAPGIFPVTAS